MARRRRRSPARHRCPPCSQRGGIGDLSIDLFKSRVPPPSVDVPLPGERAAPWAHQIDTGGGRGSLTPLDPPMTRRRPSTTAKTIIAFVVSGAAGYFIYRTFIEKRPMKEIEKPENAGTPGQIAPGMQNYLAPQPQNYVLAP